jgi:subtilisin-like proprotein convertase family protein
MTLRPVRSLLGPAVVLTMSLAALTAAPAHAQTTFSNITPISIPSLGTANPYPSQINVSGLSGTITKITVALSGLSHTFSDDLDILLVGPGGTNVALMFGGGNGASNVNLVFDDSASASIPNFNSTLVSGTYKPTNFYPFDNLTAPAPAGPYGATLSVFNGASPNGTYSLFIEDQASGDSGNVSGGWSVTITTSTVTVPEPGSIALFGMGALSLAGVVARRRKTT